MPRPSPACMSKAGAKAIRVSCRKAIWRGWTRGNAPGAGIGQLETLQSPSAAFLALSGGAHGAEACGFVSCGPAREVFEGYTGEVYALYLLKAAQGTGLGRQLFETARQSLAACGINGLYLWVLSDNPAAGFYRHMGGRALGRKMLDIGGKPLEETAYGWE